MMVLATNDDTSAVTSSSLTNVTTRIDETDVQSDRHHDTGTAIAAMVVTEANAEVDSTSASHYSALSLSEPQSKRMRWVYWLEGHLPYWILGSCLGSIVIRLVLQGVGTCGRGLLWLPIVNDVLVQVNIAACIALVQCILVASDYVANPQEEQEAPTATALATASRTVSLGAIPSPSFSMSRVAGLLCLFGHASCVFSIAMGTPVTGDDLYLVIALEFIGLMLLDSVTVWALLSTWWIPGQWTVNLLVALVLLVALARDRPRLLYCLFWKLSQCCLQHTPSSSLATV